MKSLDIQMVFEGPTATHNMPCPVIDGNPAVYRYSDGTFHPSWRAQADGWKLVHATNWFQRLLLRMFFS